jgi:hypothetical protein
MKPPMKHVGKIFALTALGLVIGGCADLAVSGTAYVPVYGDAGYVGPWDNGQVGVEGGYFAEPPNGGGDRGRRDDDNRRREEENRQHEEENRQHAANDGHHDEANQHPAPTAPDRNKAPDHATPPPSAPDRRPPSGHAAPAPPRNIPPIPNNPRPASAPRSAPTSQRSAPAASSGNARGASSAPDNKSKR